MPGPAARIGTVGSRTARRVVPLTAEALWAIKRIGTPTLSPDGALACAAVTSYDVAKNDSRTELWLYPTGFGGAARGAAARARRLTAGDKDGDPKWSPDGRFIAFTAKRDDDDEPQVYLIAPDGGEARRLAAIAGGASSIKWFADGKRLAFISWVWPDLATNALQMKRRKEQQGRQGQGARHRAIRIPVLGSLARRRARAAHLRLRYCDRTLPRRAGRHGALAAAVGSLGRRLRHRARRARACADGRPRDGAGDDEPDRHRHRRSGVAPQARADGPHGHGGRASALFAGRSLAGVPHVRHPPHVQ